jgi:hypothetical protein
MDRNTVKNIISRFVCWVLLLQLINISIDPPDLWRLKTASISQKQPLPINEIESLYELISEGVFEHDVPESDENDIDSESQPFDLYCFNNIYSTRPGYSFPVEHFCYYHNTFSCECPEPNAPPPKNA